MDLSFVTAPFTMRPGLTRMAPGERHLATGQSQAVAEKQAALAFPGSDALLLAPAFDPFPALQALARTAAQEFPAQFRYEKTAFYTVSTGLKYEFSSNTLVDIASNGLFSSLKSEDRAGWRGLAALLELALEEDFAVVNGQTRSLAMLGVALPSHWAPAEKIGLSFHDAHAPVADNQQLIAAGNGLMNLVTSGEHWQRHVWVITPSARRDAHPKRHARTPWPAPDQLLQTCYLRVERQTFIPVPALPQAVFTIHVSTHALVDVCAHPGNAERLRAALASQSDAVLAYRSMPVAIRDALVTQLSQIP